jgi:hypothetical protein
VTASFVIIPSEKNTNGSRWLNAVDLRKIPAPDLGA